MSKGFTVEQLQELMRCVADNHIGEFLLEDDGTKLRIRGEAHSIEVAGSTATFLTNMSAPSRLHEVSTVSAISDPDTISVAQAESVVITSPLVGTFYSAAGPDKDAFVKVGQSVTEGETVFIVESMKVMNEVPTDKSGVVAEILVKNGDPVEYGQPILRLA